MSHRTASTGENYTAASTLIITLSRAGEREKSALSFRPNDHQGEFANQLNPHDPDTNLAFLTRQAWRGVLFRFFFLFVFVQLHHRSRPCSLCRNLEASTCTREQFTIARYITCCCSGCQLDFDLVSLSVTTCSSRPGSKNSRDEIQNRSKPTRSTPLDVTNKFESYRIIYRCYRERLPRTVLIVIPFVV